MIADIYAATTGTDNDMVVKLIDQYPGRRSRPEDARLPADDQRGNLPRPLSRQLRKARAAAPGSIHEYKFSLHDVDHVFKAGHTVLVEIQSTWFPLYDRNPQTFVPNIMTAKPDGLQTGDHHHLLRPRTTSPTCWCR